MPVSALHQAKFRDESALILIIQIALGVVLGFLIFKNLPRILALGFWGLFAAIALGLAGGLIYWLFSTPIVLGLVIVMFVFFFAMNDGVDDNFQKQQEIARRQELGYETTAHEDKIILTETCDPNETARRKSLGYEK